MQTKIPHFNSDYTEECSKCPELVKSRSQIVKGYGDKNATFLVIGLAPGRNGADLTGVPFTRDPSGALLQEALIKAGLSDEKNPHMSNPRLKDVYITNLVKCNPQDEKGRNRNPSHFEVQNCISLMNQEVSDVKPKVIILLGSLVVKYILNEKSVRMVKLHSVARYKNGITYVPFIHPSYVIRGAYNREKYLEDFCSIKEKYTVN